MLLIHFVVNISQKECLQLRFESVETRLGVTKTVGQRIQSRPARNSKAPTTDNRPTPRSKAAYM